MKLDCHHGMDVVMTLTHSCKCVTSFRPVEGRCSAAPPFSSFGTGVACAASELYRCLVRMRRRLGQERRGGRRREGGRGWRKGAEMGESGWRRTEGGGGRGGVGRRGMLFRAFWFSSPKRVRLDREPVRMC